MAKSRKKTIQREQKAGRSVSEEVRERRNDIEESDDRSLISKIIVVVFVLIGLYLLVNFISDQRDDNGDKTKDDETSQTKEDDKDGKDAEDDTADVDSDTQTNSNGTRVEETDKQFSFTVGGGESYTTIARQAIASIDSKLTHAERVAAEAKLVSDANAEWLSEGQSLVLGKDMVQAAVDWAKSLSAEQKAAWQPYADLIAW